MPAKSKAQQRLMAAAAHGATFPMAKKVRASMTHEQLRDFAKGSQKGKPGHVRHHSSHNPSPHAPHNPGPGNRYDRLRHGK